MKSSGYDRKWIRTHYQEYLQSDWWQDVRRRYAESYWAKHGCYVCHARHNLNLHHKTYKHAGAEKLSELMYLCRDCHHATHEYLKQHQSKQVNLWVAARELAKSRQ